jgi:hypothetical protein
MLPTLGMGIKDKELLISMWQSRDALKTINLVEANVPNAASFGNENKE